VCLRYRKGKPRIEKKVGEKLDKKVDGGWGKNEPKREEGLWHTRIKVEIN